MQQTDASCVNGEMYLRGDLSRALLTAIQDVCFALHENCNKFAAENEQLTRDSVISLAKDDASVTYSERVSHALLKVHILTYARHIG